MKHVPDWMGRFAWEGALVAGIVGSKQPRTDLAGFDETQPRDEDGRWTDGSSVPIEPGTTPVPKGLIRGYHYTGEIDSVLRDGLLRSKARGESYGEPSVIWFSTKKPKDTQQEFVEVFIDPEEISSINRPLDKGDKKRMSPEDQQKRLDEWNSGFHHFTLRPDVERVSPDRFVTHSKLWHSKYRYIEENEKVASEVLAGEHDDLLSDRTYGPAIRAFKEKHGRRDLYDDNQPRDDQGRWTAGGGAAQTKSESFKAWFGDWEDPHAYSSLRDPSKPPVSWASNKDGSPKVYYHGTTAPEDFDSFKPVRSGWNSNVFGSYEVTRHGIFFAGSPSDADAFTEKGGNERHGRIMPVYLQALAPIDFTRGLPAHIEDDLVKEGIDRRWLQNHAGGWDMFDDENGERLVAAAKRAGYDSIFFTDTNPDTRDAMEDVVVVFDPSQVKSAIGNKGTFDPLHPSINMSTHSYRLGWCLTCQVPRIDCSDFDESKHPRDEQGRWTSGGGSPSDGSSERPRVHRVKTVDEAIPLILQGKVVEVPDVRKVHTVLTRLAAMATEAKRLGKDAPNYDLCQVTVPNTNLFCASKVVDKEHPEGWTRLHMPQFAGKALPGTAADALPRSNPNDPTEVDGSEAFREFVEKRGIVVTEAYKVPAALLKATQSELVGPKVAGMMSATGYDPGAKPIYISRDNYVIDGHHRWAAVVGRDSADGHLGDSMMNIRRIDAPISEILPLANHWAKLFGIAPKAAAKAKT